MPLPEKIRIGAADYKVVLEPIENDMGQAYRDQGIIKIHPDQSVDAMFNTVWHESMHMAFKAASITLSEKNEEKMVNSLTEFICQILRDNKRMRSINEFR